jgi:hypothetical protein
VVRSWLGKPAGQIPQRFQCLFEIDREEIDSVPKRTAMEYQRVRRLVLSEWGHDLCLHTKNESISV